MYWCILLDVIAVTILSLRQYGVGKHKPQIPSQAATYFTHEKENADNTAYRFSWPRGVNKKTLWKSKYSDYKYTPDKTHIFQYWSTQNHRVNVTVSVNSVFHGLLMSKHRLEKYQNRIKGCKWRFTIPTAVTNGIFIIFRLLLAFMSVHSSCIYIDRHIMHWCWYAVMRRSYLCSAMSLLKSAYICRKTTNGNNNQTFVYFK